MNQIKIRTFGIAHEIDQPLRLRVDRYWRLKQQLQSEPYWIADEIWDSIWQEEHR